jgi:hypothetical protein
VTPNRIPLQSLISALFLGAAFPALLACANAEKSPDKQVRGIPSPVGIDEETNPDVMWVVMPVGVGKDSAGKVFYGLFSCYRAPAAEWKDPAPPTCKLARIEGSLDDLNWPGAVVLKDGMLKKIEPTSPAK